MEGHDRNIFIPFFRSYVPYVLENRIESWLVVRKRQVKTIMDIIDFKSFLFYNISFHFARILLLQKAIIKRVKE